MRGIIHLGIKKTWRDEDKTLPHTFHPTLEDMLSPTEWKKYEYTEEEENELIERYFSSKETEMQCVDAGEEREGKTAVRPTSDGTPSTYKGRKPRKNSFMCVKTFFVFEHIYVRSAIKI